MKAKLLLLLMTCFVSMQVISQSADKFTGRWTYSRIDNDQQKYFVELLIAPGEQQTLYPAQLTIQYAQFTGVYHLLLVKKNEYQLVIGRQKNPIKEVPFSIGAYTIPFNGSFDLKSNVLLLNRIPAIRYGFAVPALSMYEEENKMAVLRVSEFLRTSPVALKQTSKEPWRSSAANKMLSTLGNAEYYGLVDTFQVSKANGRISISEFEHTDDNDDSISVSLNKKKIIEKLAVRKTLVQEIRLDTGLNILCFFADNYGRIPPNTAKLHLQFGEKTFSLNFASLENVSANFIVAKIYLQPEKQTTPEEILARETINKRVETRQVKWIDSISVESDEVTLAFWDDAVEDGDSISLQINDEIYMPGLAVKKQPKFLKVKLYRGENKIIFIADNLGAISPNTSILEIIDGKKRRSYMIDTDMRRNSAIKISYQLQR